MQQLLALSKFYLASYTGLSKECWRGIIVSLIESLLMGVYYFLALYFTKELHFSINNAAMIISCYGLGAIIGGMLGGKLADKFTPERIAACSLIIQACGYLALLKLSSMPFLMLNLFIIGIATYSFITTNYLSVLNLCKHDEAQRLKAINFLSIASNLGLGLSAIIIGVIITYGFKNIFFISGTLTLILAIFLLLEKNAAPKTIEIAAKPTGETNKPSQTKIIYLALLCVLSIGMIVTQMSSTYPIYIEKNVIHPGIPAISILFAINAFIIVFFEAPLGNFIKDSNKIQMLGIGSLLIGFGMATLCISHLLAIAMLAAVIYTLGEIIFFSMAQLICYQKAKPGKKGHSIGLYRMVYATSRVAGPTLGALIYTNFSGDMIWIISAMLGIFCFTLCHYSKQMW